MWSFLSTVFFLWCLYSIWRWLFPGKAAREQRRHLKWEQKLGLMYPSVYPRDDSRELRQGIDFKMGGILRWKKIKGGQLLVFKPSAKGVTASVLYWTREGFVQAGYQLSFRLHVSDVGVLRINAPQDGIFEACIKDGGLSSGDSLILLHTDMSYIEEWKAERERLRAEEAAAKERERHERYLEYLEEEKKREDSMEERLARAERMRAAAEREKAEIAEKLKEKQRRRELEKQVRLELIDSGELFGDEPKRPPIPREVVDAVYRRDGARCVYCGSTENLQLDHIIPFSKGGATSLENLQLLCQKCNLEKSNKIG